MRKRRVPTVLPQDATPSTLLKSRGRKRTSAGALTQIGEGLVVPWPKDGEEVLTSLLRRGNRVLRPARSSGYLHVSDLLSKCLRQKMLLTLEGLPPPSSSLTLTDSLTFKQGDAIHDVIKDRVARAGPSVAWGKWKCQCGSLRVETPCVLADVDLSTLCENCETPADQYEEVDFRDEEHKVVGHPDLILHLGNLSAYYITELKSISHKQFEELARPKPDHMLQSLFYWYLAKKNGLDVVDLVSVLYVTKGYVFRGDPFKEFTFVPSIALHRLEPYLAEAKRMRRVAYDNLPDRTLCASPHAPDARKCPVSAQCFRSNHDREAPKKISITAALSRKRKAA